MKKNICLRCYLSIFLSFFYVFLLIILKNTRHTKIKSTSAVSQGALGADVRLDEAFQYAEGFSSDGPGWNREGLLGFICMHGSQREVLVAATQTHG